MDIRTEKTTPIKDEMNIFSTKRMKRLYLDWMIDVYYY